MEEIHRTHPPSSIHKYPLRVGWGENVIGVPLTKLLLHEGECGIETLPCEGNKEENKITIKRHTYMSY